MYNFFNLPLFKIHILNPGLLNFWCS